MIGKKRLLQVLAIVGVCLTSCSKSKPKKAIIFTGMPASGKGTVIACKFNESFSSGEYIRWYLKNAPSNDSKKQQIEKIVSKGDLVPFSLVVDLFRQFIKSKSSQNYIILDQAKQLDSVLKESNIKVVKLINITISDEIAATRMKKRAAETGRPDDQNLATINNRINLYKQQTIPMIDYYNLKGVEVYNLDNTKSLNESCQMIEEIVNK